MTWPMMPLGAVAKVGAGNSAPQGDHLFSSGGHPFFRTSDVGRIRFGEISESADRLNEDGIRGLRCFAKGTILFPKSGASTFLNHRVMLDVDGYVSSHLATIAADESQVLARYLLYFLATVEAQDLVQDHAYPSLNLPVIADIRVPVPELEKQHRIVAILDEAFAGIATAKANAEKNLRNAGEVFDEFRESVFRGIGKTTSLGELGDFRNGVNFTKASKGPRVHVVGVKDFKDAFWVASASLDEVQLDAPLNQIDRLRENDIVLVRSNGNPALIGRCLLAGTVEGEVCHSGFTIRLRLNSSEISPNYLCHYLKTPTIRRKLTEGGTGTNIKSLNQQMLSALAIPMPEIAEQHAIVAKLDTLRTEVSHLQSLYTRKLAALDELKKSLLRRAFSGQLA